MTTSFNAPERTTALDRPAGASWHVRSATPGESVPNYVAFFRTRRAAAAYARGEQVAPICTRSCRP